MRAHGGYTLDDTIRIDRLQAELEGPDYGSVRVLRGGRCYACLVRRYESIASENVQDRDETALYHEARSTEIAARFGESYVSGNQGKPTARLGRNS